MEHNIETAGYSIPAVALRALTILPNMMIHFDLSRKKSIEAVRQAMAENQKILLLTQTDPNSDNPDSDSVYSIGTVAIVKQVTKLPNDIVRVLVDSRIRAELLSFQEEEPFLLAKIREIRESQEELGETEKEAMMQEIQELFRGYCQFHPKTGKSILQQFQTETNLGKLLDSIAANIPLSYQVKQKVLECISVRERFQYLSVTLSNETEVAGIKTQLANEIKGKVEKNQKEYILREQMNYIRQELGEDDSLTDAEQFAEDLKKLKASKEVKDKIKKEISRFKGIGSNSSESSMQRSYIETLLELPWDKVSKDNLDLRNAEEILEQDHYGLEKVKERILEFLAVRSLTSEGDSPILCLVGPPGTGKTSIARSIARALNKKYVRICLGGVRDEAEIRGHRKTYVGAMPGRIITGLRQAEVKNPLILLDEIDKMSSDYKGDTASALLEVLDAEQNCRFRDHYVEIPTDLSQVLFIATANSVETIPRPLLDRMELLEINSYTANEKFHIARQFLVEKQLKKNGLADRHVTISDQAIKKMIQFYTREAGVRGLERKIGEICRKSAIRILKDKSERVRVTAGNLESFLGVRKYTMSHINGESQVGIARGLAWTSVGGDTLQIEVNVMPGKGELELTGQLGDVMKESALTGISFVRSVSEHYQIKANFFEKHDFHIHIPEGAVPKDGPSAGITMATALLSAITNIPVRADVAMTGEITLRGRVLPIGGLKEKLLAAKEAGVKTVLVPKENQKDLEELSTEISGGLKLVLVEKMEEVIENAFEK